MTPIKFRFVTPIGTPIAGASFDIQLAESGYSPDANGIVMPQLVTAITDGSGEATVDLWSGAMLYYVTMLDPTSDAGLSFKFYVPTITDPAITSYRLQDIVVSANLTTLSYDLASLLLIQNSVANTAAYTLLTHADVVSTHLDAVATAADRVQTNEDRTAASASAVAAIASQNDIHDNWQAKLDAAAGSAITAGADATAAQAAQALAQAAEVAAESAQTAAEAARDAALAGDTQMWPTTVAGVGQGVQGVASLVGGTGAGANNTYALAFSATNQVLAPIGNYVVVGGVVTQITITYPGYYTGGTVPTLSFAASGGSASATAVMAVNTAAGKYFAVLSADLSEVIVYQNVDGLATERYRTSTSAEVLGLELFPGRAGALAAETAAFARVKKLELFGADASKYYSVQYLFWKDIGTRFTFYIVQHTDTSGTGSVAVAGYTLASGADAWTGPMEITLAQVGGSGITGTAIIDFTDSTACTVSNVSTTAAMYQRRAINTKCIKNSTARSSEIRVQAAVNRFFNPGVSATLNNLTSLKLYGTDPAKFYYVNSFYYTAVNLFQIHVFQSTDAAGTGAVEVASISTTGQTYTGKQQFSLAAVGVSGITGMATIDFAALSVAAPWSASSLTYATGGINPLAMVTSTAEQAYLSASVVSATSALRDVKLPFADSMTNSALQNLISDIKIFGADPTHDYIISQTEMQISYRVKFVITDITVGHTVCYFDITASPVAASYAALPTQWKLSKHASGDPVGVYAVITINWAAAATGTTNYTTMAQAGISKQCLYSEKSASVYLTEESDKETIAVAASGGSYTTIAAALAALYDTTVMGGGSALVTCARSCPAWPITLDLDTGTFNSTDSFIPEFVGIRGKGMDSTYIWPASTAHSPVFDVMDTRIRDLTIVSDTGDNGAWTGNYCVHRDSNNFSQSMLTVIPSRRLRSSFQGVRFLGGLLQNWWLFGCGVSSGEHIKFIDCEFTHSNPSATNPCAGFHNSTNSHEGSLVEMIGCRSQSAADISVQVVSQGAGSKSTLRLVANSFGLIWHSVSAATANRAADRMEWRICGNHNGPIITYDSGAIVLKTTAGQTPSGTGATAIFGTTDELGQGELCITTGTSQSLGARLGDCSSVNKTLTIGAQTYTATTNLTAVANSTIIAAINAVITTNPVSEQNIQYQNYPDVGSTRLMLNSTGATLSAGKFVKRTGATTIALADGTDDVFGFLTRDILTGNMGKVITEKNPHGAYITNAAGDGKFGITAGLLDYGAATKVGYVSNGIVRLY